MAAPSSKTAGAIFLLVLTASTTYAQAAPPHIPQTSDDWVWWAFNIALLVIVAWAKYDLGAIKSDSKIGREIAERNESNLRAHQAVCAERHTRLDIEVRDIKRHNRRESDNED